MDNNKSEVTDWLTVRLSGLSFFHHCSYIKIKLERTGRSKKYSGSKSLNGQRIYLLLIIINVPFCIDLNCQCNIWYWSIFLNSWCKFRLWFLCYFSEYITSKSWGSYILIIFIPILFVTFNLTLMIRLATPSIRTGYIRAFSEQS